jgi:hypothetical protein
MNLAVRSKTMRSAVREEGNGNHTPEGGPYGRAYGDKWGHGRVRAGEQES